MRISYNWFHPLIFFKNYIYMCVWQWKNNNFKLNYFLKLIGIGLGKTRQYLVLFRLKKRTLVLFILKK